MRTVSILALGAIGAFCGAGPCAAQSSDALAAEGGTASNSSAFSKSAPAQQKSAPSLPENAATPDLARAQPQAIQPVAVPARQTAPLSAAEPAPKATPAGTEPAPPYQRQSETHYDRPAFTPQAAPLQEPAPSGSAPPASLEASQIGMPDYSGQVSASTAIPEFASAERLLDWVSNYRDQPQYWKVPAAVHAMRDHRLFTDEEQRWFCIGFIAGVLGTNPKDGPGLIPKMFPMPPKEQEVIVRAIAYSGRPDWQDLLVKSAAKMPLRKPLIDDMLDGRRPTLQAMALDTEGAKAVYALWGYYVASGQHEPVVRIMQALQWSKGAQKKGFFGKLASGWGADANNVEKVTTGGTAKWTLASYAERDRELIRLYQAELKNQPEEIAEPLKDVIEAAELFEAEKIRKEQYGAIEDAERQQFTADAGMSKGWTAGSIAIATGCMAASALGQAQIAVPCVIGGALYSGAGKLAR